MAAISSSSLAQQFDAAVAAYRADRPAEAMGILQPVLQADPRSAAAHHLSGLCLLGLRDIEGAERALRLSLSLDKRRPAVLDALAEVLSRTGRPAEAEKTYRSALAVDRRHVPTVVALSRHLVGMGRPAEALQITTPVAVGAQATAEVLDLHAETLRRLGRPQDALAFNERAVAAGGPFSELDLAGTLRELGRYEEAYAAARRCLSTAGRHPAVLAVLGRTLQDLGRHDEAEAAYRDALTIVPFDPAAHQALAELLWARTADPARASAALDSVLRQQPAPALVALKAKLLSRDGKPDQAYALLLEAVGRNPNDPLIQAAAATAAVLAGDGDAGVGHARKSAAAAPGVPRIQTLLAETLLAAGQPGEAAEIVAGLRAERPHDQQFIALQAAAWRMLGDPRYGELYDYERMVGEFMLPTPDGWSSLEAYLSDLAAALKGMHAMRGDPLDQSLRNGTQTEQNLALSSDPVIQAFFRAVEAPIRGYIAGLGKGRDPLRSRNLGGHHVKAAWSVRLDPDGFHADHLHPDGWLSSAFYVELPKAIEAEGREGWIKFGQSGAPTRPALAAEHFVKPAPGKLVLFPSYMWHGTVPFSGEEQRLTMAFDVVPGR